MRVSAITVLLLLPLVSCSFLPVTQSPTPPVVPSPPGMVLIPAGPFWMGSDPGDGTIGVEVGVDEAPRHLVDLPAFYIDKFEVTNAEYAQYVNAVGSAYQPAPWRERDALNKEPNHPVGDTDFHDAEAYCRWAGKRLPTEAEWEKAARGPDGAAYPWGPTFSQDKANTMETGLAWSRPVGSYPGGASVYGVEDMIGNVWEWTGSWYKRYPGSTLQRAAFGEKYRVLRGGSWGAPAMPFARATNRHAPELFAVNDRDKDWHTGYDVGFRCAKDVARP